jgi:UDP-glucose 4-epimerase
MSECVLVTGGAGYIGSHVAWALLDAGWRVVVVDNLSTGRRELVPSGAAYVHGDVGDGRLIREVLRDHGCAAVMHFAGSAVVPESVANPLKYYLNNTAHSRTLVQACVEAGVRRMIFSSSAAVYGIPEGAVMVDEDQPTRPINPYGCSKLMTEWMLRDAAAAGALRYVALRYFNVAGADLLGRTGQATPNATHLIKVACETALGARPHITVFGEDYDTTDGTCVRDYIHVSDLATAHVAALEHLCRGGGNLVLNCGYGHGFSVRQVLDMVGQVSGHPLPVISGPRRPGDPPALVADSRQIRRLFGWQPRLDRLEIIVRSALAWERKRLARGLAAE